MCKQEYLVKMQVNDMRQRTKLIANARLLRRNMTKEERHLWYDFLCEYPINFRRQKPILVYVVDFYCAKAKLAVELDGSQHMESAGQRYDMERTKALKELGIEVIRFPNNAIWNNFSGVCIAIDVAVKRRLEFMP